LAGLSTPERRQPLQYYENSKRSLRSQSRLQTITRFTEFTFDFGFAGDGIKVRTYYAVTLPRADTHGLVLKEGADLATFEPERLLAMPRVVPYDAFALWMHHARGRIASTGREVRRGPVR
jgi:hypothetical protein